MMLEMDAGTVADQGDGGRIAGRRVPIGIDEETGVTHEMTQCGIEGTDTSADTKSTRPLPQKPQRGTKSTQVFYQSFARLVLLCGLAKPKWILKQSCQPSKKMELETPETRLSWC